MKKNIILSTVAATVVTGVLMLSGCTSSSNGTEAVYIAKEGDIKVNLTKSIPASSNGTVANGTVVEAQGSTGKVTSVKVTLSNVTNAASSASACPTGCELVMDRSCARADSVPMVAEQHNNACIRAAAFAQLATDGYTPPAGKTLRFSGIMDFTATGGMDNCTADIEFQHPPCATDADGTTYYVNYRDRADTTTLRIYVAPLPNACGTQTGSWHTVTIQANQAVVDRKAILSALDLTGLSDGVRLTVFSVQDTVVDTAAEDEVDQTGNESTGATGSTGTTGGS